jgi:hypothetical protein
MPVIEVRKLECYGCGHVTPLLAFAVDGLFSRLSKERAGISVFFSCPACRGVAPSEIPFESEPLGIPAEKEHPDNTIPFSVTLECGCQELVSVLGTARLGADANQARRLIEKWKFDERVRCANGHPAKRPYEVAGITMGSRVSRRHNA